MDESTGEVTAEDLAAMRRAVAAGWRARLTASPNPWVGAVVEPGGFEGATSAPGGPHAEAVALAAAGPTARGATLYVTVEPCCDFGAKRTPPCTAAIVGAGIRRVVVAIEDPDPRVAGRGIAALRRSGLEVDLGADADAVRLQLAPYIKHRLTGCPYVVLKLAATLDGRSAAPDGTSQWITGPSARADGHRLRAESDAVLVGAGTVRADDPSLTVRHARGADPRRVVLGRAPAGAKVHPCTEVEGDLRAILADLGGQGVLQLLVEGGPNVAGQFHRAGLVDRYVVYLAPALAGGSDAPGLFSGPAAPTVAGLWRGRLVETARLGDDLKVVLEPAA